ncbi:MAG: lysophospholipase [Myxococcales bacterium]|nr:lysophospholipase [Myxococcales bacterium]
MGRHDVGFFTARDNLRLYWESTYPGEPEQVRAHVGIVHGYMDHCGRYRKTVAALVAQGCAVHAFDYRGHGQADGRRGYCDAFSDYVDDLELFWARLLKAAGGKKAFLLAHSHGGLMALHFLRRSPQGMSGLVLSAPYLKLALKPPALKVVVAKVVGSVLPWLAIDAGLDPTALTRDVQEQRLVEKDPLYNRVATPRWFNESNRAQLEALRLGGVVTVPVLVICGGSDGVASTPTSKGFFETIASADKRFREYEGMLHEPLNEVGREEVWKDISGWISAHT